MTANVKLSPSERPRSVRNAVFRLEWPVSYWDFHSPKYSVGVSLQSPIFTFESNRELKWYMKMNPGGIDESNKDNVSLFVGLTKPTTYVKVRANVKFSILNERGFPLNSETPSTTHTFIPGTKAEISGHANFIKRSCLVYTDPTFPKSKLTIVCELRAILQFPDIGGKNEAIQFTMPQCRVPDNLRSLFEEKKFSDVTLIIGGRVLRAHKVVLAIHSPVFSAMFQHDMMEQINNEVQITDVTPEAFNEMLRFMYTGEVRNIDKIAESLLVAADKYALERLKVMCEESLYRSLAVENAADILILADTHHADQLKPRALKFIASRAKDVMATARYKSMIPSYPHLVDEAFKTLAEIKGL